MQTIPSPRGFRGDVNGLRAWAVMAVILYHFGVPGFGGGFVGVDVFFVISGFLMTGIVIKGLEQGSFSVLAFYGARIRRIVPALLGLCFFLLVLGYAVLSPPDYKTLATHALSAISFVSNLGRGWLLRYFFPRKMAAAHMVTFCRVAVLSALAIVAFCRLAIEAGAPSTNLCTSSLYSHFSGVVGSPD
jgi:peptidoglycan/LPS O-acetylase OafA/YrhL